MLEICTFYIANAPVLRFQHILLCVSFVQFKVKNTPETHPFCSANTPKYTHFIVAQNSQMRQFYVFNKPHNVFL